MRYRLDDCGSGVLKMSTLKPYQVTDNDIVLAENVEQATELLIEFCGYTKKEFERMHPDEEPFEVSLELGLRNEDGTFLMTLGDYISSNNLKTPQYLVGWE